jgi:hypothetical protein
MRLTRMIEAGGISEGGGATAEEEMDGADSGGRIRQRVQCTSRARDAEIRKERCV